MSYTNWWCSDIFFCCVVSYFFVSSTTFFPCCQSQQFLISMQCSKGQNIEELRSFYEDGAVSLHTFFLFDWHVQFALMQVFKIRSNFQLFHVKNLNQIKLNKFFFIDWWGRVDTQAVMVYVNFKFILSVAQFPKVAFNLKVLIEVFIKPTNTQFHFKD